MNAKNAKPNRHWMFKHFMACDLDMDFLMLKDVPQPHIRQHKSNFAKDKNYSQSMRALKHSCH